MKQILPILADIANGIFAVLLAGYAAGTEVAWWHFLVGIPLALLPDLDAVPELLKNGKVAAFAEHTHDHRDGLHFPILFLLIGICASVYIGFFGYIFLFATMFHFINDLYGTGWGIPLFWPFSKRKYKFFGSRANQPEALLVTHSEYSMLEEAEQKQRLVVSWSEDELPMHIKRFGFDDWIDKVYLTVNWISIVEYSLFFMAVVLLIMTLLY